MWKHPRYGYSNGYIIIRNEDIIHLEAINFSTGETSTDQAPIVVGIK